MNLTSVRAEPPKLSPETWTYPCMVLGQYQDIIYMVNKYTDVKSNNNEYTYRVMVINSTNKDAPVGQFWELKAPPSGKLFEGTVSITQRREYKD